MHCNWSLTAWSYYSESSAPLDTGCKILEGSKMNDRTFRMTFRAVFRPTVATVALIALALSQGLAAGERTMAVTIGVDAAADSRPISPLIYGLNWATPEQMADLRATVNRRGGNATTRYNWQQNADNRASDWFFESLGGSDSGVPGADADAFVEATRAGGGEPIITIPTIGWAAKLGPNRERLASFSVAKYGPQQRTDPYFSDAGNGVRPDGALVTGNDPNDANMVVDSTFQRGWVEHLVTRWGGAAHGGVRLYCLDNEPSIWFATHRDVCPTGTRMEEMRDRIIDYAARIREADPAALLIGPEEWGWNGYIFSGYDQQYMGAHDWQTPDRAAHDDADYLPWLLGELRRHDESAGTRSLDVFSVHFYPQGGETNDDVSPQMQLLRNRSTRALWDPSYVDQSWIRNAVRLIPRMRQWSDENYPGLKLAITEYNWGVNGHINGATAQADVLGLFGREGLYLATWWASPNPATPAYKAFKLYRNYDGAGGEFGDTSVRATAPNPDEVSAFASVRSSDGALTVMVINKTLSGKAALRLSLANFAAAGPAAVWQLTAANRIARLDDVPAEGGEIAATLPKQSITLFVVPAAAPDAPRVAVVSPNGGEKARAGTTLAISWTADGQVASQDVLLSSDGGQTFPTRIAEGLVGSTRSYEWSIPADMRKGKHYRARVVARAPSGSTGADTSDGDFRIKR
jgi:hypothetical protein